MIDPLLLGRVLLLLAIANGAPILAARILGRRCTAPVDLGASWRDGRRLLGNGKTFRGIAAAIACTAAAAPLLGFGAATGVGLGAAAMAGDLLSSFIKRRLGLPTHARALGLDQVPEALVPMLLLQSRLGLGAADIAAGVAGFVVLDLALSRLLFALGIRQRPY